MKRLVALCGALVLALVMATPAAAAQKLYMKDRSAAWDFEEPVTLAAWGWECSEPVYFGGRGSYDLWLWYPNDVDIKDPLQYMPDKRAWPWIKGKEKAQGDYYFSTGSGKTGKVISGKFGTSGRLYDHHLGAAYPEFDVPPPSGFDRETFKVQTSGVFDSLHHPKVGWIWRKAGVEDMTLTVTVQHQQPAEDEVEDLGTYAFKGKEVFDDQKVCQALGLDFVGP